MNFGAFPQFLKQYPEARKLWASETVKAFGSYFFNIAVMWFVFAQTGSGVAMGLVVVANFLPTVILGPWFGVLADRHSRRRLMMWANLASGLLAGLLALSVLGRFHAIWLVYVVRGLMGVASSLYDPARASILPDIVGQDDLLTAHALFHSSQQVARLIGSAMGGLAVALAGVGLTMTLDVLTFAAAAIWVARIAHPDHNAPSQEVLTSSAWKSAFEGWQWLRQRPVLLVMMGIGMVSNIALGPTNVLPPMLIRDTFHASARALGLFDSAMGLGIVVGGVIIGMFTIRRMGLSMAAALGLEATGLLMVAVSPTPVVADVGNFLLGGGLVAANAPGGAMMQTLVPSRLLGRVSSFSGMLSGLAVPITFGAVGVVGDAIGAHRSFGLATVLMASTVVAALMVPGIRRFRLTPVASQANVSITEEA
ncbi:MFS transporter [Sulfobacillus harzensis]|uniref:MFS transporter n=1 Tax=Sulfobacillus harzensis TaxID=2729629 RepID=A0A7Y0L6A3_9FIRM|nr:MFS transporter [Sulfobacillus harzensis]